MTFLFAARKNPLSIGCFLLRWFEGIPFSHCALLIDGFVYESVFPKSRAILYVEWIKTYDITAATHHLVHKELAEKIKTYVRRNLMRKRYSLMQIFLLFCSMSFHSWDSYIKKTKWNGSKYLVCTELVAIVAHKFFGVEFHEKLDTISLTEAYEKIGAA